MKARIKKTGEVIEVARNKYGRYVDENCIEYSLESLDFGNEEDEHWTDVRERAAIAVLPQCISTCNDVLMRGGALQEGRLPAKPM